MNLFELSAKLGLDASAFTRGIKQAESAGGNLSEKMSGMFNKIENAAKVFISGAVINKAVSLVRGLANETAEAGDRIDKQSQILGMSRKAYQEWDYIMGQNGMSIDQMTTSMKTLNGTILSGLDGSKEAKSAFAELGLSIHDLEGMSQEDQFETVVKAFQKMPPGAEKSALAVKLFGKAGMQMLPLLNSSTTSIDELRQKAEDLGLIMGDDAIDASVAYTNSLDTLKHTFNGLKYAIGAKVLPLLTKGMEKVANYAGKLTKAFNERGIRGVIETIKEDVQNMRESDSPFLRGLGDVINGIITAGEELVALIQDFPGKVKEMKESDSPLLRLLGNVLDGIKATWDTISDLVKDFPGKVAEMKESESPLLKLLGHVLDGIKATWDTIVDLVNDFPGKIKEMKESDSPLLKALAEVITLIKDGLTAIVDIINGDWTSAIDTLKNSDSTIAQTIGEVAESFVTAKNRAEEAIDATKEFLGVAGSNGKLYGTYTARKAQEFYELETEGQRDEWLKGLRKDMMNAGFTYAQADAAMEHFSKYELGDESGMVGADLGLLSNPVYYDKDAVIKGWQEQDNVVSVEVEAVTNEDKLQEQLDMQQQIVDKDPLTRRIIFSQFSQAHPYGATGNDTFWVNPGENPVNPAHNAKGMWDVPYDGYLTELHRGERVLSASQARRQKDEGRDMGGMISSLTAAVKDAIENADIRTFVNGRDMTDEVNRNNMRRLKARRFAT